MRDVVDSRKDAGKGESLLLGDSEGDGFRRGLSAVGSL